jgi:hypothetical protein
MNGWVVVQVTSSVMLSRAQLDGIEAKSKDSSFPFLLSMMTPAISLVLFVVWLDRLVLSPLLLLNYFSFGLRFYLVICIY